MNTEFVKEYRAQLTIPHTNCLVTVTGATSREVQNLISTLLNNKARFDNEGATIAVTSGDFYEGKEALGSIVEYQVPESMSIKAWTEHRLESQKQLENCSAGPASQPLARLHSAGAGQRRAEYNPWHGNGADGEGRTSEVAGAEEAGRL